MIFIAIGIDILLPNSYVECYEAMVLLTEKTLLWVSEDEWNKEKECKDEFHLESFCLKCSVINNFKHILFVSQWIGHK